MGSGKKQTVAYKYYVGVHNVLCHGPVDAVTEMRCGEKVIYAPFIYRSYPIVINKPTIFGGDPPGEGGIQGTVDVLFGDSAQEQNSYLQSQLGTDIPAYRGVVSVVYNQCYLGNSAYLKPWDYKVQRVHVRQDGIAQWYSEKAGIGAILNSDVAVHFALDFSTSMNDLVEPGVAKYQRLQESFELGMLFIKQLIETGGVSNISLQVKLFTDEGYIKRNNASAADVQNIIDYVNSQSPGAFTGTSFENGFEDAPSFFAENQGYTPVMILLTDGGTSEADANAAAAIRDSVSGNLTYGVQYEDGDPFTDDDTTITQIVAKDNIVPLISFDDAGVVADLITQFITGHLDLNPAHIIRECLTDPDWGMGYAESDIDDTAFTAAADQLYAEGMGMSLLWDQQIAIEDFIVEIITHIDAVLYVSRYTGKFVLKLIRDDYDEGTLITLGKDEIKSVKNYQRINPLEAVNTIVVNYWDWRTGEQSSVTADNLALIRDSGSVNATTIKFEGFTNDVIAGRVAARELNALSSPILSCDLITDRSASVLNIGDVFKFEWPDYHTGYVLMRVMDIKFGKNSETSVKIKCSQDVFALPANSSIGKEDGGWTDPNSPPVPADINLAEELTYFDLAQSVGDAQAQEILNTEPDAGYVKGVTDFVTNGINGTMSVDAGGGYGDEATYDFAPTATLDADVSFLDDTFTVTFGNALDVDLITLESYALIDSEYIAVTAIDSLAGTITVKRGVLDTPPEEHLTGASIIFCQDYYGFGTTQYLNSESLDVQLRPTTSLGTLDLGSAPVQNVVMASRAHRPYPPGNVQFNGTHYLDTQVPAATDVVVTWSSRNRLQQTSASFVDFIDTDVTPEVGTTYRLVISDNDTATVLEDNTGISAQTYTMLYTDYPTVANFKFELFAERDGYESLRAVEHVVNVYRELLIVAQMTGVSFVKAPLSLVTTSMNAVSFVKGSTSTTTAMNAFSFVKGSTLTTAQMTVISFVKAP